MPQVNTSDIQAIYNEQLARLYYLVEYSPDDVLAYVLSGVDLSDINIIVAADVDNLPYLYYGSSLLPSGMVYFVQSLGIIVISSANTWLTLDGVLVRTDIEYDNIAWAWGDGGAGRLGNNTTISKSSPVSVVGGFCDWCQVGAGGEHSLGLRQNSQIWSWGCNGSGRLGDNTTVNKSSPVSVVGGFCDWRQISGGGDHSLATRQTGTAWAWGDNGSGQLGDNTTANKSSPVSVVGGYTDWCQISAGRAHSLAVRQNGTLWAWGSNQYGRLGDNTTVAKSSPVSVIGGFTDWCQASAGTTFSLAVRQNGTAWGWGRNNDGVVGDNTTAQKSSPVSVVGGFTDWCQISAGDYHSLAVRQNGTAWAWGRNSRGQLGTNQECGVSRSSPVSVVGGFTNWVQVCAGAYLSLGLRNGSLLSWGNNIVGQLGDNTTTNRSSPVSVLGGINNWFQVSTANRNSSNAGCTHTLGVTFG